MKNIEENETRKSPSIRMSLPREQQPLPPASEGAKRYTGLNEILKAEWGPDDCPTHAFVRCILSVEIPKTDFGKAYAGLRGIRSAFGRRALVSPVSLDHHEYEVCELIHMVDLTGQHEVEPLYVNRRVDGGTHILLAVESDEFEGNSSAPLGLDILEALEAILRAALGNSALVNTRYTRHMTVSEGNSSTSSPDLHIYGSEECARAEAASIDNALNLVSSGSALPLELQRRLILGLRWANVAFKSNDLLSAWTALEILAGGHGTRVYRLLSKAYGLPRAGSQEIAKRLGVQHVFDMRNAYAHEGKVIHYSPSGASFLLALAHDLAREIVNLPAQKNAERLIEDHKVDVKTAVSRANSSGYSRA